MLLLPEDSPLFLAAANMHILAMTAAPPRLNMFSRLLSLLIRLTIAALLVCAYFSTWSTAAHAQTVPPAGPAASVLVPPFAPPTATRFEHLSLEDGLSQSAVLELLQDRDGFLWVGTQGGLVRFDGVRFQRSSRPAARSTRWTVEGLAATMSASSIM